MLKLPYHRRELACQRLHGCCCRGPAVEVVGDVVNEAQLLRRGDHGSVLPRDDRVLGQRRGRGPAEVDWASHRTASINQHPMRMGTKVSNF